MHRTSSAVGRVTVACLASLALTACMADQGDGAGGMAVRDARPSQGTQPLPAAGGVIRSGASFGTMADQYTPRAGPVAATGASAWVKPAPAPAFVAGPPPPAGPSAPPPAAVANRQPGPGAAQGRPPLDAAEVVRPEAAAPAGAATPDADLRVAGLALFNSYSCGTCHVLGDAGAGGAIGPALDGNPRLTRDFAIDVIANGRGAMPSFAGQMSEEEIATLADYIVQHARK